MNNALRIVRLGNDHSLGKKLFIVMSAGGTRTVPMTHAAARRVLKAATR